MTTMYDLLSKYPNLAAFMATFKKGDDDLYTYRKFMVKFQDLQKRALAGDAEAHAKMLDLGFVKDPEIPTHYVTKPEAIRMFDFYKAVN
jgi:hypothetical protein